MAPTKNHSFSQTSCRMQSQQGRAIWHHRVHYFPLMELMELLWVVEHPIVALRDWAQLLRHSGARGAATLACWGCVLCHTICYCEVSLQQEWKLSPPQFHTTLSLFLPKFALKVIIRKSIQYTRRADSFVMCELGQVARRMGLIQFPKVIV